MKKLFLKSVVASPAILLALVMVSLVMLTQSAQAVGEKTFTFNPPTAYVDGTPLPQSSIASYDIQCDGALLANVPNAPLNTDTYQAPPGTFATGDHICNAFTVTTDGLRSEPSNSANFTVAPGEPGPPINFAVQ